VWFDKSKKHPKPTTNKTQAKTKKIKLIEAPKQNHKKPRRKISPKD